jgi:hypothetical protein
MVRQRTLDTLGEIGAAAMTLRPAICAAFKDEEPMVRQAASAALDKIEKASSER